MQSLKKAMSKVLEIASISIFAFITIVGAYQIITRYIFNSPSTVSEELLTYSFTWLAFLAAALVFGRREHMRMEFIADKFKGKSGIILSIFSELIVLLFSISVLVYGGMRITKLTTLQVTASLGIPMSYIYIIVPISGILIVLFSIINITELISEIKQEKSK